MRKLYAIILIAFIGFSFKANAQIVNIPDGNFKTALIHNGVPDSAGYITVNAAKAYKYALYVNGWYISDLTGIEAFTSIPGLDCSTNYLTSLNLSSNTALTSLDCYLNKLTNLDFSFNTALIHLNCSHNSLTSLNLLYTTALTWLDCSNNRLTSLNLSSNTTLATFNCRFNFLTSLNLSSNILLNVFDCSHNSLTSLNVSTNSALVLLYCDSNNLGTLNVKNGVNGQVNGAYFNALGNSMLTCIEVDDSTYSATYWHNIDAIAHFSTTCNYVGINELTDVADINIYPNPISSRLTIATNGLKMASVNIYDVLGQLMYNRNLTDNKISIDMNAAPAGIYLLQIMDAGKNIINRRIIKQ